MVFGLKPYFLPQHSAHQQDMDFNSFLEDMRISSPTYARAFHGLLQDILSSMHPHAPVTMTIVPYIHTIGAFAFRPMFDMTIEEWKEKASTETLQAFNVVHGWYRHEDGEKIMVTYNPDEDTRVIAIPVFWGQRMAIYVVSYTDHFKSEWLPKDTNEYESFKTEDVVFAMKALSETS